jgi:hypothetical protein
MWIVRVIVVIFDLLLGLARLTVAKAATEERAQEAHPENLMSVCLTVRAFVCSESKELLSKRSSCFQERLTG